MDTSKTFLIYPEGQRDAACVITLTAEKIEMISSQCIEFSRGQFAQTVEIEAGSVAEEIRTLNQGAGDHPAKQGAAA